MISTAIHCQAGCACSCPIQLPDCLPLSSRNCTGDLLTLDLEIGMTSSGARQRPAAASWKTVADVGGQAGFFGNQDECRQADQCPRSDAASVPVPSALAARYGSQSTLADNARSWTSQGARRRSLASRMRIYRPR